ncbi:hypothetical protein NVV76_06005 [Pediococcus ethanolidurans]|uniref:oligosaccharide flippase family protein n=1 Tax=Pediococcus ethanolidurans TaxID=319653 RepID=UPI0021E88116|nr:oligosaccharide flippase family protein [Pediococcus ethanolidurans]MCV3327712.1 hypothetical protein [Pediococcus ethanolidurans]
MNFKKVLKNVAYSLSSNVLSLIISTLVVLVVPKLIGVREYGYFQLYVFYTAYVGIFPLGWIDGIYLRYGGYEYGKLDKKLFHSQYLMYAISQIAIAMILMMVIVFFVNYPGKETVLLFSAVCLILYNIRAFVLFILQGTNRIKEYASITVQDRVVYLVIVIIVLLMGKRSFVYLILADLLAKLWTMIYAIYACRDITSFKNNRFFLSFHEMWANISSGIKLLIANFASLLIIGSIRFSIENFWGVKTFGKVSLILSVSSLAMTFVTAVSLVLFPLLRRTKRQQFHNVYINIRDITLVLLLSFLFLYFPLKALLPLWLPKYSQSMIYLSILFPMCFYEGKFELLTNTFMKTLRLENKLLMVNCLSVLVSVVLVTFNIIFMHNLNFMIFSIIISLAFRSSFGEILVSKKLKVSYLWDILGENFMALGFITITWNHTLLFSFIGYLILFIFYLFLKRKSLKKSSKYIHNLVGRTGHAE